MLVPGGNIKDTDIPDFLQPKNDKIALNLKLEFNLEKLKNLIRFKTHSPLWKIKLKDGTYPNLAFHFYFTFHGLDLGFYDKKT